MAGPGCTAYAAALCHQAEQCGPGIIKLYGTVAHCEATNARRCGEWLTLEGVTLTDAAMQACADAYAGLACDADLPAACEAPGTLADGSACNDDRQCAGGNCRTSLSVCGECEALAQEGGSCSPVEGHECASGLTCSAEFSCLQAAGTGDPCPGEVECANGLVCADGTCIARLAEGARCDPADAPCALGLTCDATSQKCHEKAPGPGPGEPCDTSSPSTSGSCRSDSWCDSASDTCKAKSGEGGSCTDLGQCLLGLLCAGGTCVWPPAITCD